MKHLIIMTALGLSFSVTGFLLGKSVNKPIPLETTCNYTEPAIVDLAPVNVVKTDFAETATCENLIDETNPHDIDIESQLVSQNDDDRMDALFFIWRTNLVDDFSPAIEKLAKEDPNQHIVKFARWILNPLLMTESDNHNQPETIITNFDNPEEQLKDSLVKDTFQFTQSDEKLPNLSKKDNLLDALYQLPEDEQIIYLNDLSRSQEDAAIEVLFEVISHYNTNLKNAAIEELLMLLADRTGHFDMITETLKNHQYDLSDEQQHRFALLSAETSREVSKYTLKSVVELEAPY
jgi:hypothetical protein